MRLPNKRTIAEKLLLVLFGLLVAFLLLEAGLRVVVVLGPGSPPLPNIAEFNPELGWSYIPNADSWETVPAYYSDGAIVYSDALVDVNINSFGFRDDEWQLEKNQGTKRIAFVGDSYMFGRGLEAENRLSELLESENCEALNFGVSGYSSDQELLLARKTVLSFRPDVIVLGLFLGNDVEDNAVPLPANTTTSKPYFILDSGSGALVLKNFPVAENNAGEKRESYFLLELKRWLSQNIYSYSFMVSLLRSIPFTNNLLVSVEKGTDFTSALDLTAAIIEELGLEAEERDVALLVLIIPSPNQLSRSDDKRNTWVPYLRKKFDKAGIKYIALLEEFNKFPEEHFYFAYDEHLDAGGNEKVAELLRAHQLLSAC